MARKILFSSTDSIAIVADVGGTHIRFATLKSQEAPITDVEVYICANYHRVEKAIDHYLAWLREKNQGDVNLSMLCLALPGAVHTESVTLTNLSWIISKSELTRNYGCQVELINDFTAQAFAIRSFKAGELDWLRPRLSSHVNQTEAIIGPGTGLGVAALLPSGEVIESEAGHIGFSPKSHQQQQLLTALWPTFPRVSIERLISGPGLINLYRGLNPETQGNSQLTPEEITRKARDGDQICLQVITEFSRILGSVCGDLALAFGAVGGIYLSGGILINLDSLFDRSEFLQNFDDKGRFTEYCNNIPVALVLSSHPGLTGAANFIRPFIVASMQMTDDYS